MLVGYKVFYKTKLRVPATIDLFAGKQAVDDDENMWLEKARLEKESGRTHKRWYKVISWLF